MFMYVALWCLAFSYTETQMGEIDSSDSVVPSGIGHIKKTDPGCSKASYLIVVYEFQVYTLCMFILLVLCSCMMKIKLKLDTQLCQQFYACSNS